jgi:hypothetical protein
MGRLELGRLIQSKPAKLAAAIKNNHQLPPLAAKLDCEAD